MLLGRRQLLRLGGMAAVVAAADPLALALTSGDRYFNERLGLSFNKPAGWHFLSVVDFQAAARGQRLAVDDPDVLQVLQNPDSVPFVVVTKFDAGYTDLNPCITCWGEPIEPDLEGDIDCHQQALRAWARFLPGVSVLAAPTPLTLQCGTAATLSVWRFLFEHDSGRSWHVNARTLLLFRSNRIHTFHFMDADTGESAAGAELTQAAQSLSYRAT
jgi:hypothetical protein